MVASDGGVFAAGDAGFYGSLGSTISTNPSSASAPPPTAAATGWSPRTAGSSTAATPGSTDRPVEVPPGPNHRYRPEAWRSRLCAHRPRGVDYQFDSGIQPSPHLSGFGVGIGARSHRRRRAGSGFVKRTDDPDGQGGTYRFTGINIFMAASGGTPRAAAVSSIRTSGSPCRTCLMASSSGSGRFSPSSCPTGSSTGRTWTRCSPSLPHTATGHPGPSQPVELLRRTGKGPGLVPEWLRPRSDRRSGHLPTVCRRHREPLRKQSHDRHVATGQRG